MTAPITIQAEVGEDRQLTITLPDDMPIGPVELVIRALPALRSQDDATERERIRAKLQAAGVLANFDDVMPDTTPLSDEELEALSRRLPPGKKSIDEMIDEDREDRLL